MFGLCKTFTCKKCETEQTHHVGITELLKLDDREERYIPLRCFNCNTLHFVVEDGYILNEVTEEEKEKAFEERAGNLERTISAKKWFMESTKFVAAKEA